MGKTLRQAPFIQKENNDSYCIDLLQKALERFCIPAEFYSIGEYAEEAVCLEKRESGWTVYDGERGNEYNSRTHVNCREACHDIISRVAESVDDEKKMTDFFNLECEKTLFGRLEYQDIQELRSNMTAILSVRGTEEYKQRARSVLH